MNPILPALRAGIVRGGIELRQTFTNSRDLWGYFFPTVILLVVMVFQRSSTVAGTQFSMASMTLPSALGMSVGFAGLMTVSQLLIVEREDGTLLRAKAIPHGILGYLVGKVVVVAGISLVYVLLLLIPGLFLFDGLEINGIYTWFTLVWVVALGLLATMPIGAIAGSLLTDPRQLALIMFPTMGMVAISGIFYPITQMPEWTQWIAQVFPMYWLGLGIRSALLPGELASAEIGDSWRHLETLGVLSAWAIAGIVIAPMVLRRMARRESGSSVAARREKAMQRIR